MLRIRFVKFRRDQTSIIRRWVGLVSLNTNRKEKKRRQEERGCACERIREVEKKIWNNNNNNNGERFRSTTIGFQVPQVSGNSVKRISRLDLERLRHHYGPETKMRGWISNEEKYFRFAAVNLKKKPLTLFALSESHLNGVFLFFF